MKKSNDVSLSVVWKKRLKLYAESSKLYAKGDKLYAEGNKLYAEGPNIFRHSISISFCFKRFCKKRSYFSSIFLKYGIVFNSPSSRVIFGSQPRSFFASVMSGLRVFGSFSGSGS